MNFEFLSQITPVELPKVEHKPKGKTATPKNPTGLRLRIFKDGAVYPSQELVDKFYLEYLPSTTSNLLDCNNQGFDVFNSADWVQMPKDIKPFICIAAVSKELPKVDLFGSCKVEGTSVLTQGSKRPELVEMIRSVYNKNISGTLLNSELTVDELFGSKNYIDLEVNTEVKVFEGLPAYYFPTKIVKGEKAGQMSYNTRPAGTIVNVLTLVEDKVEEVVVEQVLEERGMTIDVKESMFPSENNLVIG